MKFYEFVTTIVVAFVVLFVIVCGSTSMIISPDAEPLSHGQEIMESNFHFKDSVEIVSGFYSGQRAEVVQKLRETMYIVKFNICDDVANNSGCVMRTEVSATEIKKILE